MCVCVGGGGFHLGGFMSMLKKSRGGGGGVGLYPHCKIHSGDYVHVAKFMGDYVHVYIFEQGGFCPGG